MSIKLNIKSPTALEDKCLASALESRVLDVKKQIQEEWPTHPSPKDQRLVYAGKLLEDDNVLKDVLRLEDARDENDAFTIHLVCRITTPPPSTSSPRMNSSKENTNLRHRRNVTSSEADSPANSAPISNANWSVDQNSQAILMQQMYANYMTQYVQYLQSIGAMSNWPPSAAQNLVDHTNQVAEEARLQQPPIFNPVAAAAVAGAMANNLQQQPPQQQQPAVAAAAQPQPQQPVNVMNQVPLENDNIEPNNVVLNAGAGGIGAMEDEDDLNGGQRDVLDWCYVATRVLVLFSIVYFYSSFARFALAAGLGIIFYLYNNGFFGAGANNAGAPAGAAAQNQPQQPADQHDAAVNEVRQVAGAAGGDDVQVGQVQLEPQAPHPLNVLSTFITTFFTSLLPNDPQII